VLTLLWLGRLGLFLTVLHYLGGYALQ
jgi:hypothetical protein